MKKILLVILALAVIFGGATYWFLNNLDDFIKDYMVDYGSKMTKTDVEVDSVETHLNKGEISINRLGIENPKGFSNNEAFEVGKVVVTVKKESLNQDIIEIPLILIKNPEILYEYNGKQTNFDVLIDNIKAYQSFDDKTSKGKKIINKIETKDPKSKNTSKTFFIQEVKIVNLEIRARVSSIKKDFLNKKIPLIVIKNIGSKTKGVLPESILEKIISNVDNNLESNFDFKSLKIDIKQNINKIIDKLSGGNKDDSDKEKIDHQKVINNLKDLF